MSVHKPTFCELQHASVPLEERKMLGIADNLIRLSVGLEDVDDLIADLDNALRIAVLKKPSQKGLDGANFNLLGPSLVFGLSTVVEK